MRVGILTYHCVPNFGAQLQAMSTIGYLKKMGHTPILLHWYPKDLEALYARRVPKIQRKSQMQFAETHFPLSSLCRNEKQLIKEIERQQLDMIITGSDALFKYKPICDRERAFSKRRLRFVNNYVSCEDLEGNPFFCDYYGELSRQIPVVAFSVSSQGCPYYKMTAAEREKMRHYLRNFKKITVRDQWTKSMVEEIAGLKNIEITPDPVFAFNQNCYIPIPSKDEIQRRFALPDRYSLFSFSPNLLNDGYVKGVASLMNSRRICPIALPEPEGLGDYGIEKKIHLPLSPVDWYSLIYYSEGYIGTRMHPIIVCLHNCIPFFSFDGNLIMESSNRKCIKIRSKIYDIVNNANLAEYLFFYNYNVGKLPSANLICNLISRFPKTNVLHYSKLKLKEYEKTMCLILSEHRNSENP